MTAEPADIARRPRTQASLQAEAKFRERLGAIGATLLQEYQGARAKHRVRCAAGHECTPTPDGLWIAKGVCQTCAGNDPQAAEAAFRALVEGLGGSVLEETWRGVNKPHRIRCAAGHENTPCPANARQSGGICRTCVGLDPQAAWEAFRARVTALDGILLERSWLGSGVPHKARCAAGHDCMPIPNTVRSGGGICRACVWRDPATAFAEFRDRVTELGGVVLEPKWLGSTKPHRIRCAKGHVSTPAPGSVRSGNGICRFCAHRVWDAFYVVANDDEGHIKFGITSGNPRPRLGVHARSGFDHVLRNLTGLSGDTGPALERTCIAALRDAKESPVRGREYYPARALALVLDIVDNYPLAR